MSSTSSAESRPRSRSASNQVDARDPGRNALIVAVFARSDQLGGAERSTIELAAEDATRGGRWLVLVRDRGPGPVEVLAEEHSVRCERVANTADLVNRLRHEHPAAVWAFGLRWSTSLRFAMAPRFVKDSNGVPASLLVAQRGLDSWRRPAHNRLDRSSQALVDAYVTNSDAAGRMLIDTVGIAPDRVSVIHSGLSGEWLRPVEPADRPSNDVKKIMMVANNRPEKAYGDAIEILSRIRARNWAATIYTNEYGDLRAQLASHGIADRVTIVLGHRLTPDDYCRADLLLHASHSESYPRAVLEALASRIRVVASDAGDVHQVLDPSCIFEPGDVAAATKILDRELAAPASANGYPSIAPVPSQLEVADKLRHFVSELRSEAVSC